MRRAVELWCRFFGRFFLVGDFWNTGLAVFGVFFLCLVAVLAFWRIFGGFWWFGDFGGFGGFGGFSSNFPWGWINIPPGATHMTISNFRSMPWVFKPTCHFALSLKIKLVYDTDFPFCLW